jgi:hypothetical protein
MIEEVSDLTKRRFKKAITWYLDNACDVKMSCDLIIEECLYRNATGYLTEVWGSLPCEMKEELLVRARLLNSNSYKAEPWLPGQSITEELREEYRESQRIFSKFVFEQYDELDDSY